MVTLMIASLKIATCKQLSPPKNEHPYIPTLDTTSEPGVPGPLAIDGRREPKFGTLPLAWDRRYDSVEIRVWLPFCFFLLR